MVCKRSRSSLQPSFQELKWDDNKNNITKNTNEITIWLYYSADPKWCFKTHTDQVNCSYQAWINNNKKNFITSLLYNLNHTYESEKINKINSSKHSWWVYMLMIPILQDNWRCEWQHIISKGKVIMPLWKYRIDNWLLCEWEVMLIFRLYWCHKIQWK